MNIEVKKLEDALNPFNKEILSEELDKYIVKLCQIDIKNAKELNIICNLNLEEKKLIENTIHNHYTNLTKRLNKVDKYDNYIRIVLLFIGIILLLISEEITSFIKELFLITGWVFIWEMLYDILFNQIKRKRKNQIY